MHPKIALISSEHQMSPISYTINRSRQRFFLGNNILILPIRGELMSENVFR